MCTLIGGARASWDFGRDLLNWRKARKEGDRRPFRLTHPAVILILLVACLGLGITGLWLVLHSGKGPAAPSQGTVVAPTPSPAIHVAPSEPVRPVIGAHAPARPTVTPSTPALHPPQPASGVHGSDNTLVGNVGNRSVIGDGNTVVGATDSQGNTILNQGGTAIGRGATADPTSIAIGAGAHAGGQQSYGPQTCVGSACAQGPGSQATFNQFGPPRLEMTSAQRETIRDAMKPYAGTTARIMTSTNDDDAKQFGTQLVGALQDANLSVTHKEAGSMVVEGAKPFGISINFSEDHQPAAIALEKEILKLGVRPAMTLYKRPQDIGLSFLTIVVQPTR